LVHKVAVWLAALCVARDAGGGPDHGVHLQIPL